MLNITVIFKLIIKGTNIFTLNTNEAVGTKIDRLADVIAEAITFGYEAALHDYAVWKDGEQKVGAGIYTFARAQEKHKEDMALTMRAVRGKDHA